MQYLSCLFTAAAALLVIPGVADAREISVGEAASLADRFIMASQGATRASAPAPLHSYTAFSREKAPLYYVFNYEAPSRFVIVSADDRLCPILGYSDSSLFDDDDIPDGLQWLMEEYSRSIEQFLASGMEYSAIGAGRIPVGPLVTTRWSQGAPFNAQCPKIRKRPTYTGCVATAMAQIVNYHQWPAEGGNGFWEYSTPNFTASFDFGAARFDWANMADVYDGNSTPEQEEAVAQLMYACGVAVDMTYGLSASGSVNALSPDGLKEYFGYDPMTRHVKRRYYSDAEWEDMIYTELAEGRPVIYGGYTLKNDGTLGGGHSFVCDGCDSEGYFHINWGWGGVSDGYFLLSLLSPEEQGIGSYEGGYNSEQDAVIGIMPPSGRSAAFHSLYSQGTFKSDGKNSFKVTEYIINESLFEHTYTLGVRVFDSNGKEVLTVAENGNPITLTGYQRGLGGSAYSDSQYVYDCKINVSADSFSGLADGVYDIYPVYRTDDMDWAILHTDKEPHYVSLNVGTGDSVAPTWDEPFSVGTADGTVTVKGAADGAQVEVYDITGRRITTRAFTAPALSIPLPDAGLYIVKCGPRAAKIRLGR